MSDSDRELLEWAAKAYGDEIRFTGSDFWIHGGNPGSYWKRQWSPLTDDGDIARLESALDIDVYWYKDHVSSHVVGRHFWVDEQYSDHGGDKNKARRYASTRAAAEIGRRA